MKKLGIVCASLSRGGAERVAIYLSKYMVERGVESILITATRGRNEYVPFDGVERICLSDEIKNENKWLRLYYQVKRMRTLLKEKNIDTVLIMGVPLCIYAIPGCLGTGVKVIVSERNDPQHFSGKRIVKYLSRLLMRKANGYVFQTEEAKRFYSKHLKEDGVIIPNPLLAENLPKRYVGEREKVIVTAGRLTPQKNQKLLIDAFAEIKDDYSEYKLVIYGEGDLEQELKSYVSNNGLCERILFPGNVDNLLERIHRASMFVMPSNFEGMPNALIEAMAIGLPCVSTDCPCGGPSYLINNGENGLLVSVKNKQELVVAMRCILDDAEFATQLGIAALDVKKSLSIKNIGEKWYEYLNA